MCKSKKACMPELLDIAAQVHTDGCVHYVGLISYMLKQYFTWASTYMLHVTCRKYYSHGHIGSTISPCVSELHMAIHVPIVMYGLRLFIVVLQELHSLLELFTYLYDQSLRLLSTLSTSGPVAYSAQANQKSACVYTAGSAHHTH